MNLRESRISKVAVVIVLDIEDRMLRCEEGWEPGNLPPSERHVVEHLEIFIDDVMQHQRGDIFVVYHVSLRDGVDHSVLFFLELLGLWDDAPPAV